MKKWFSVLMILFSINLISAASLSDLLNELDESAIVLFAIFLICFSFIFFALSKFFKDNKVFPAIISMSISLLIIYGINKSGLDLENIFSNIGVSGSAMEAVYTIAPFVVIAGIIFAIVKFAKESLIIVGGFFLVLGFLIEEGTIFLILGIILIIVRFFIPKDKWKMKKKGFKNAGAGI